MKLEILLVTQDDHGAPIDPPVLLINDHLHQGVSVDNGLLFTVTLDQENQ